MTYEETIQWLFTQTTVFQRDGASAYKPGLGTVEALCAALGNPPRRLRCIHVAGTNGKGSTAHTLAAIMQSAGLRTGLYTSPHLVDFRERIRVDGRMIPRERVSRFVEEYQAMRLGLQPSFFELTTALAFKWFAEQQVDIAIIEVGLGGRLDSTNIITPLVSVVTNISLDHTSLLGNTPVEIAAEKAGIFKEGVPAVIGEADDPAVRQVFIDRAAAMHAPLTFAKPVKAEALAEGGWYYPDEGIRGELSGEFQPKNAATVLAALRAAGIPEVTHEAIAQGFANVGRLTGLRGRMTVLRTEPTRVVYDTGHNPGAWRYIGPWLAAQQRPITVVVGFAADKDVSANLSLMPPTADYIFTRPTGNRGMDAEELKQLAAAHGLSGVAIPAVADAVEEALRRGTDVFVGGSNFVVADMLAASERLFGQPESAG